MKRLLQTALAVLALATATMAAAAPAVGQVPPDLLGQGRNGDEVRVSALHGKVVVVTFWATWCTYCMKELPILAGVQKLAGPTQLQVVAISHKEDRDTFRKVRNRLKDQDLIFTFDGTDSISKAYGVNGIPHMVMIGRDGRIAHVHIGYGEDMLDQIADELNELLAAPAPGPVEATAPTG